MIGAGTVALSLLIAAIWGFNFVVIKVGVASVPPLALATLRFLFSVFPAILFVKRPRAPLGKVAAYGLFLGVGEFGFLFTAIKLGAPAGLSSILLQSQAFLTALLASIFLGEKLKAHNFAGMSVAALGLALFALGAGTGGLDAALIAMIVAAALGWAAANVTARSMPGVDALGLMVWSSLFSPLPLAALSLLFEGPSRIAAAFSDLKLLTVAPSPISSFSRPCWATACGTSSSCVTERERSLLSAPGTDFRPPVGIHRSPRALPRRRCRSRRLDTRRSSRSCLRSEARPPRDGEERGAPRSEQFRQGRRSTLATEFLNRLGSPPLRANSRPRNSGFPRNPCFLIPDWLYWPYGHRIGKHRSRRRRTSWIR